MSIPPGAPRPPFDGSPQRYPGPPGPPGQPMVQRPAMGQPGFGPGPGGPRPGQPGQMVSLPHRQGPGMMAPPPFAKRPMGAHPGGPPMQAGGISKSAKKKKKLADKILPQKVRNFFAIFFPQKNREIIVENSQTLLDQRIFTNFFSFF